MTLLLRESGMSDVTANSYRGKSRCRLCVVTFYFRRTASAVYRRTFFWRATVVFRGKSRPMNERPNTTPANNAVARQTELYYKTPATM